MKLRRLFRMMAASALFVCTVPLLVWAFADSRPNVQLNVDNVRPHQLEEQTRSSIVRDYALAWRELNDALANNAIAPLSNHFTGYALQKLTQRVKDQQEHGLKTRIIDHGHKLD
ncbi:MAG TPA: hypothetical protein VJA94_24250, partial [Candidatus Angelobacter sp.]